MVRYYDQDVYKYKRGISKTDYYSILCLCLIRILTLFYLGKQDLRFFPDPGAFLCAIWLYAYMNTSGRPQRV